MTVSFSPSTTFPLGGIIRISNVVLENTATICTSASITATAGLGAGFGCLYNAGTSYPVSITSTIFTSGANSLTSSDTVTLYFASVRYNTQMSAQSLTVSTTTSGGYEIELSTNSTSWIPAAPAAFGTTFSFSIDNVVSPAGSPYVCTYTRFNWNFAPAANLPISTSSLVVFTLYNLTTISNPTFLGKLSLKSVQSPTQIYAIPNSQISSDTTIILDGILLPSTAEPYQIVITTYVSSTISSSAVVYNETHSTKAATPSTIYSLNYRHHLHNFNYHLI